MKLTERKFTDEEIIKALEICTSNTKDCLECPALDKPELCDQLHKLSLDLLHRQKVEIEKLCRDRYQILSDGRLELLPRTDINAIKAEAIKEFAERLKPKLSYYDEIYVDTLVKEMTEA